ncbi:hypothetical protein B0T11DRAFT_355540 [Plectosphaerella cucumerina]|uniref:Uncharacterized protein n=1 Tax=Plectosphaerella cucumerina TaxID=40658 RepID=A0A8K0X266_9PEZI|nr:hypothetical protein B0T11DRAFT_355540 [Plectosphaerella cucumerina]
MADQILVTMFPLAPGLSRYSLFATSLTGALFGPRLGFARSPLSFILTAFEQLPFTVRLYSNFVLWTLDPFGTKPDGPRPDLAAVILETFDQETVSKLRVMAEDVRRTSDGNMSVVDAREHHEAFRRLDEYMRLEVAKRLSRSISIGLCNLTKLMFMLNIGPAILKWGIALFGGGHASDHE